MSGRWLGSLLSLLASVLLSAGAVQAQTAPTTATATFAGGCFWCVESDFDKIPGVLSTTSGYIGGTTANPTYQQVSRNGTGHAEAVEIVFDPAKVSYATLVEKFWRTIDPTNGHLHARCRAGGGGETFSGGAGEVQAVQGTHRDRSRRGHEVLPG